MRNAILVLLAGPLLFGCLDLLESSTNVNDNGATDGPSGNSVPTISGNPSPNIKFGELYSFRPDAVDTDGDALTFKVQNKPIWASFDPTTGAIYGRPTLGDVGFYDNIIISVSDGKSTTSLQTFAITVSQSALGAVTLSWVAPTQNSDGSPLTDLAGYKIYYRTEIENYYQEIRIDNPGITTYVIEQLSPATYFFAATAYNISGVESAFSGKVMRVVD
jgi:hypothetical protein